MRPIKILLFLIVGASTILMGIGAWMYFAPAYHPEVKGTLVYTELPGQREIIDQYFQKHYGDVICVHEFFARDDETIFLEMMCGNFRLKNNEVEMTSGHRMHRKVDYKLSPLEITGFKNPDEGSFHGKSLVRMFPEKIYLDHVIHTGTDKYYVSLMDKVRVKLKY